MDNNFYNFISNEINIFQENTGIILNNNIVNKYNINRINAVSKLSKIDKKSSITGLWKIIYDLSDFFNKSEIDNNGIIFTPKRIADKAVSNINFSNINMKTMIIDPAVGSGSLLLSFLEKLNSLQMNIDLKYIVENNIYGFDIKRENIESVKCIISIFMEINGYYINHLNLFNEDSLKIPEKNNFYKLNKKFDIILGNPPYVRAKKISKPYRDFIKKEWGTVVFGMPDLYIPFFALSEWLLNDEGLVSFISPNSFFSSMNGRRLRKFIVNKFYSVKIENFNYNKVFGNNIMAYSTIICLQKKKYFTKCILEFSNNNQNTLIPLVNDDDPWRLISTSDNRLISKLENQYVPLKDFNFKNGIATQRNSIYSFFPESEDNNYFIFDNYKIEKDITRNFVLPNKSKFKQLKIIFPYYYDKLYCKNRPINEKNMKKYYPYAYNYLLDNKSDLQKRKSDNKLWYAYGRSQGIQSQGNRLYIPYMAKKVHAYISTNTNELFAAGYAIFDENIEYLRFIKSIIESKIFQFYIYNVSKPYSSGYFSTAKNMIKNFSIPSKNTWLNNNYKSVYEIYNFNEDDIKIIESKILN